MASRSPVPYSTSRDLRSFDPLMELHREMDRLFDDVFTGSGALAGGRSQASLMSMPRIDVHENEREICISADLPGVTPAEVDLRVDGDLLTISGEKKSQSDRTQENYHIMERGYGRFQRTVQLPFAPDPAQVRAECHQGVLTVHLPKQGQQQRSRRIEVQEGAGAQQASGQGSAVGVQSPAGSDAGGQTGDIKH